jgi:cell division protein FtsZ
MKKGTSMSKESTVREKSVSQSISQNISQNISQSISPSISSGVSSLCIINEEEATLAPKITVIGVGGAGSNAVNNMIRCKLQDIKFLVANTDAQSLAQSQVEPMHKIQLGLETTQGLGAGSKPEVGKLAAEETITEVMKIIEGSHMLFVTAGMGGGTGTGAAPVIAKAAKEAGILTIAVVTKPFEFEGMNRMRVADAGIIELQSCVDTLIVIPNQNLFRVANENTTFVDAFRMADHVLFSGVKGITDLMMRPGLINLDFADVRSIMADMGRAMMGTGEAEASNRAIVAAEAAVSNPLLESISLGSVRGLLINITGGSDLTLYEVNEAALRVISSYKKKDKNEKEKESALDSNIIIGSTFDESMEGKIRVSVVATGIGSSEHFTQVFQPQQQEEVIETIMMHHNDEDEIKNSPPPPHTLFDPIPQQNDVSSKRMSFLQRIGFKRQTLVQSSDEDNADNIHIPAFLRRKK